MKREYESLDALAEEFPPGTRVRYRLGRDRTPIATVHGVTWCFPRLPGGGREPALVIDTDHGIGLIYPVEVIKSERPPYAPPLDNGSTR
jgi:hypothetical protein